MKHKGIASVGLAAGLLGGSAGALALAPSTGLAQAENPADSGDAASAPEAPDPGSRLRAALEPLVDDGTLTQEQADAGVERLLEAQPDRPRRHGPGLDAAAEAIGVSVDDVRDALREGQSVADLATANGVDPQAVVEAMVAELEEHLAERVAEGELTQEEADEKLAEARERITDMVNGELRGRGPDGARPDGVGPDGPGPAPSSSSVS